MGVKTIFKTLIGTIVILFVFSAAVELFNVSTTALQINQLSKMAARQAATLFTQETYKEISINDVKAGATAMSDIIDENGAIYISGDFYGSTDSDEIYDKLYKSEEFKNWVLNNPAVQKGNWYNLRLLQQGLFDKNSGNNEIRIKKGKDIVVYGQASNNEIEKSLARLYIETKMTPANLGIPYLDRGTVTKIFKWNLAQILSNYNPSLIKVDESGKQYVLFKGFRVYADMAEISSLEYKTYDLTNESEREEFINLTHLNPDNLGFKYDENSDTVTKLQVRPIVYSGTIRDANGNPKKYDLNDPIDYEQYKIDTGIDPDTLGYITIDPGLSAGGIDERTRVCVVGINYRVPMSYEGITPIKYIFNYIWDSEVEGLKGSYGKDDYQQWNDALVDLESGGFTGGSSANGVLPVPGRLIYYIIK